MAQIKRPWTERWLDVLYPPSCPGCGAEGYGFCADCIAAIQPQRFNLTDDIHVYGAGLYRGELRSALLQTKLLGHTYFSYALAQMVLRALPLDTLGAFPVAVVPMPASIKRRRQRGYSCPHLIAKSLSRAVDSFAYRPDILSLTRELKAQKTLTRSERFKNVQGAYIAQNARDLYILLVDDVFTTGASAQSAASALYEAGALRVDVAVLGVRE